MKWNLAGFGLLALLAVDLQPAPADACGVKLSVKSSRPRKGVARSSRPSQLLVIGAPPRRLERDLSAAGHSVEVEPAAADAKKDQYAVVIVDSNEQASEARTKFASAIIVQRSGDVTADLRSVEDRVARRPVRTDEPRVVVAARVVRTPVAASQPQDVRRRVAASQPDDNTVQAPTPVPTPVADVKPTTVTTSVPKVEETRPTPPTPTPTPAVVVAPTTPNKVGTKTTSTELHDEVYFSLGSATLGNAKSLAKDIRWLTENADIHVVVEGHADPTGTHEGNMALSQSRAETVRDHLVSAGIDTSRIEVIPYGDTHVKYGATDARNRRVAIEAKKPAATE